MPASVAPFRRLFRHFLASFVDNDLISPVQDLHGPIAGALAVLVVSFGAVALLFLGKYDSVRFVEIRGVFKPSQFQSYAEKVAMGLDDKTLLIGGAMIVMALITVFFWDSLAIDERDRSILGPLPLRPATVLLAKSAAVAVAATISAVALNILPAALFPIVVLAKVDVGLPTLVRWVIGHAVAGVAGCFFIFLTLASVRGLVGAVLPLRVSRRLLPAVQFVAILALLSVLLGSPLLAAKTRALVESGSSAAAFYPPLWFLGIEEVAIGRNDVLFTVLAHVGVKALAWAALAASAVHLSLLWFRRQDVSGDATGLSPVASRILECAADVIAPRCCARVSFLLTVRTLVRSRPHRVHAACALGAALAVAGATVGAAYGDVRLGLTTLDLVTMARAAQFNLIFFLVVGIRLSAAIPADVDAAWVFRYHATPALRDHLYGTKAAIFSVAVVPLLLALVPLHAWAWGWYASGVHLAFGLLATLVLLDIAFAKSTKLPFVSALTPGGTPLGLRFPLYAVGYVGFVYLTPTVEQFVIRRRGLFLTCMAVLLMAGFRIAASRSIFRRDRIPDLGGSVDGLQQLGLENFVGTSRMQTLDSSDAHIPGGSRDALASARLFASMPGKLDTHATAPRPACVVLAALADHVREDLRSAFGRLRRDRS